jgi:hypothetical protein
MRAPLTSYFNRWIEAKRYGSAAGSAQSLNQAPRGYPLARSRPRVMGYANGVAEPIGCHQHRALRKDLVQIRPPEGR